MFLAENDPEEYQKEIAKLTESMFKFNEETGEAEFLKGNRRVLKELATLTNQTETEMMNTGKKYKEMVNKITKKVINAHLAKKTYKIAKKTEDKLVSQMGKCNICKNNKTKTCNFKNYIEFSGAEIGKCNTL